MSWKYFRENDSSSDEEEGEEEREAVGKVRKVEEVRSPSFVVFFLRAQLFRSCDCKTQPQVNASRESSRTLSLTAVLC
jgi:hypothetical protein